MPCPLKLRGRAFFSFSEGMDGGRSAGIDGRRYVTARRSSGYNGSRRHGKRGRVLRRGSVRNGAVESVVNDAADSGHRNLHWIRIISTRRKDQWCRSKIWLQHRLVRPRRDVLTRGRVSRGTRKSDVGAIRTYYLRNIDREVMSLMGACLQIVDR